MASEHPQFQRFPSQIVPESAHSPRWMPLRASAPGADSRINRQSRPYWFTDLSGCICNERIKDTLYAMLWRNKGQVRPVLNYIPTFHEIGQITGQDWNGDNIVEPESLGVVGPGNLTLQLRKRLLVEGYEEELIYYYVTKPHHDYPPLKGLAETVVNGVKVPVEYVPMQPLMIYLNNAPLANNLWACNRDTGQITFSPGQAGPAAASGGFYILQLMPNEIPMSPEGGMYKIKSGVRLEEPMGGR